MNNVNNTNQKENQNNKIEYTQEQVQQILDILDSIPLSGFVNHQKMVAIVGILNEPFKKNNTININKK